MKRDIETHQEHFVYEKDGITYVPHYRNSAVYVGPGYPRQTKKTYNINELMDAGAKPRLMSLWPRSTFGLVDEKNL